MEGAYYSRVYLKNTAQKGAKLKKAEGHDGLVEHLGVLNASSMTDLVWVLGCNIDGV